MTREAALALVRELLGAARRGDFARLSELYADDAVVASPMFGEVRGSAAIAETWRTLFASAPDSSAEISHVLVDGDRIAVLSSIATVDRSGLFGLPPTGGPIRYKLVLLFTVANGRVVRDERIYDSAGVIERLEKTRLDKELRTAADVQRMLLTGTSYVNAFSASVGDSAPCRAIGGDFFEILEPAPGAVGLVLADVAGKGPAAALLAALVQGMLAFETREGRGPAETLARLNRELAARQLGARYVTLVYAVLTAEGRLLYANAGHNPPALVTRSGVKRLANGGPILGAFAAAAFEESTLELEPGDTLVMFTDGVTEAVNAAGEEFGEARLLSRLVGAVQVAPAELLAQIFADVRAFCHGVEQTDDITVTVTRFAPARAAAAGAAGR